MSRAELVDPAFLASLRHDMIAFARVQLRDAALAEDAVQEALAAALDGIDRFSGASAMKTWVFGILRNKIVDILRRGSRSPALSTVIGSNGADLVIVRREQNFRALHPRRQGRVGKRAVVTDDDGEPGSMGLEHRHRSARLET